MELTYIILVFLCLSYRVDVGAQLFRGNERNNDVELTERLVRLETKLEVYEEDRKQLFKYFDTLTVALTRLVNLETKTDNVQTLVTETRELLNGLTGSTRNNNMSLQNLETNFESMKNEVIDKMQRVMRDKHKDTERLERDIEKVDRKTQTLQQRVREIRSENQNITTEHNESRNQCNEEIHKDVQKLKEDMAEVQNGTQRTDMYKDIEVVKSMMSDLDARMSVITTNLTRIEDENGQVIRQEVIQRLADTDGQLTTLRLSVNNLTETVGNIKASLSQQDGSDRPAAHLMGISSSHSRHLTVLGKAQEFPIIAWAYNEGLAFTNNVRYRLGRIIIPSDGLYYVYSQASFRKAYNMKSFDNNLSHFIYRYNIMYPGGGEEKLAQNTITKYWRMRFPPGDYTSYLGALFYLRHGDEIYVKVSDVEAIVPEPKMNYFGLFKLS